MYTCPDCGKPLHIDKKTYVTSTKYRYFCKNKDCNLIEAHYTYEGKLKGATRQPTPRLTPLNWLTMKDILYDPTILEKEIDE